MKDKAMEMLAHLQKWVEENVLTVDTAIQWGCVALSLLVSSFIWRGVATRINAWAKEHLTSPFARWLVERAVSVGATVLFVLLIQVCASIFWAMDMESLLLKAASDLGVAWIIIKLVTSVIANRTLARAMSFLIWVVAALQVLGLSAPITAFLQDVSIPLGESSFSALGALKGLVLVILFWQVASLATRLTLDRINKSQNLTPSLRVLLAKVVKVAFYTAAILMGLSAVGIDLTSFAIFSSALGVGIGFGLKTIISNYVAGVILLMDRSIKPGDTIESGDVFGVVRGMYGRYTSVLTRSGKEHLIPNEQLVSSEVVNWTYSDTNIRLQIPVGISYGSDVDLALELMIKATENVRRVLRDPKPNPLLIGFGDNSVNLELRAWISDSDKGVTNVRSEIMQNIWHLYHEYGIEFPFPQRDVLLKPDSALNVTVRKTADEPDPE